MSQLIPITEINDERLADYRDLRDADLRGARKLFTVESPRVLERFLGSEWPIESILVEHDVAQTLSSSLQHVDDDVPVYVADNGALRAISGYGFHGGALALGRRNPKPSGLKPLDNVLAKNTVTLLAAEGVVHVDNMGSLFRNAACLGADGVLLSPTCADPLFRKTVRISTGRVFTVPWAHCETWPQTIQELQSDHGFHVVALESGVGAAPLHQLTPTDRTIMLVGAEGAGLSQETLALCNQVLEIPTCTGSEAASVNVAVASAIGLYELGRSRRC